MKPHDTHLHARLRELHQSTHVPEPALDRMETVLRTRFDRRPISATRPTWSWRGMGLVASAAGVGAVALIGWLPPKRGEPAPTLNREAVVLSPTPAPSAPAAPATTTTTPAPVGPRGARPVTPRARVVPASRTTVDDFVALEGAAWLPDFDSGHIVRVDVPLDWPLAAEPGASQSMVEADVLMGQDGLPRAIRLVSNRSLGRVR